MSSWQIAWDPNPGGRTDRLYSGMGNFQTRPDLVPHGEFSITFNFE